MPFRCPSVASVYLRVPVVRGHNDVAMSRLWGVSPGYGFWFACNEFSPV